MKRFGRGGVLYQVVFLMITHLEPKRETVTRFMAEPSCLFWSWLALVGLSVSLNQIGFAYRPANGTESLDTCNQTLHEHSSPPTFRPSLYAQPLAFLWPRS